MYIYENSKISRDTIHMNASLYILFLLENKVKVTFFKEFFKNGNTYALR